MGPGEKGADEQAGHQSDQFQHQPTASSPPSSAGMGLAYWYSTVPLYFGMSSWSLAVTFTVMPPLAEHVHYAVAHGQRTVEGVRIADGKDHVGRGVPPPVHRYHRASAAHLAGGQNTLSVEGDGLAPAERSSLMTESRSLSWMR